MQKHVDHTQDIDIDDNVSSEKVTVLVRRKQFVKGCIVGVSEHGTD